MGAQLLILAAGLGRRFGGLKQLVPVGPSGETLFDYTLFDALRSGFDEAVLVVRPETEAEMRRHVEGGAARHIALAFAHQDLATLPGGRVAPAERSKPWGTTHAVLAARELLTRPFGVANADDYYGRAAVAALGGFLSEPAREVGTWAMVGFAAADTLPSEGAVSRGIVRAADGWLERIEEVHTLRRHPEGAAWDAPEGPRVVPPETPVSMNLWGFGLEALDDFERRFSAFLESEPGLEEECYLPEVVGAAVTERAARVRILEARSRWCGMTAAKDLESVRSTLRDLVEEGVYPDSLWS